MDLKSTKSRFYHDDILYGKLRPYLDKAAISSFDGICSTDLLVLVPRKDQTIAEYLINILHSHSFIEFAISSMKGTNHPRTSWKSISEFQFALPPLPEQRRIATILTTVDDAIQRSRQAFTETERLKAGVMHELMTKGIGHTEFREDPNVGKIPKEWDVIRFEKIIEFLQYGLSSRCDANHQGIPVLGIPNIIDGLVDVNDLKYLKPSNDEFNKFQLFEGDLLFVRTNGQKYLLGRSAIYKNIPKRALFASYLIRARLKTNVIISEFALYYTKTSNYRSFIDSVASGAADGKYNLNTETLKSLLIPIPSIDEQKKIISVLCTIDRKLTLQRQRTAHFEKLKQGLMNELLTGKLRVKVT